MFSQNGWPTKAVREAATRGVQLEKVFLEILQNSQERIYPRVSLLKKKLWHRCFPVNFVTFLRTPFCIEHLRWVAASTVTSYFHLGSLIEIFVIAHLRHAASKIWTSTEPEFNLFTPCKGVQNCVILRTTTLRLR